MKKFWKNRQGPILVFLLLLALLAIPALKSSANEFSDPFAVSYQFEGDSVEVKQAVPFYDSGTMALYNDDSLVIYQKHPQTGELLQSKVSNVQNVKAIVDETRVLQNDKKVLLINSDVDESYAYSAEPLQNLNNVIAVAGDYYLTQSTGSTYQVKYYNHETPGAGVKTVCSLTNVKQMAGDGASLLFLKEDGTVWAWGANTSGQLGQGTFCTVGESEHNKSASCSCASEPVQIKTLKNIVSIAPGAAVDSSGAVYTWGGNETGKLGSGAAACTAAYNAHGKAGCTCKAAPQKLTSLSGVQSVWASGSKTYALCKNGDVYQWGEKDQSTESTAFSVQTTPQKVAGVNAAEAVFPGANTHHSAYIKTSDGLVYVLGYCPVSATMYNAQASIVSLLSPQSAIVSLSKDLSGSAVIYTGDSLPSMPTDTITGKAADGTTVSVQVLRWECETSYNPDKAGTYVFSPVFSIGGDYRVIDSILPKFTVTVKQKNVTGIALKAAPKKTSYVVGQSLDLTGGTITVSYDNNTKAELAIESGMVSGYNPQKTGSQKITVAYQGFTTSFTVTVSAKKATGIEMKSYPNTTDYYVGDSLSLTGGSIYLVYNDGSKTAVTLTSGMVSGYNAQKAGTQTITVTYEGFKTTFKVVVRDREMTSGTYTIDKKNGYLSKIAAGTSVSTLKSGIAAAGGTVKVYNGAKEVTAGSVGTGMTVQMFINGAKKQTLTLVVTGDVNGDGKVSGTDLLNIHYSIMGTQKYTGAKFEAADINGDGKITGTDLLKVNAKILNKGAIVPR